MNVVRCDGRAMSSWDDGRVGATSGSPGLAAPSERSVRTLEERREQERFAEPLGILGLVAHGTQLERYEVAEDPLQVLGSEGEPAVEPAVEARGEVLNVRTSSTEGTFLRPGLTVVEALNAGLVDEFHLAVSPVLFGDGVRLFDGIDVSRVALEQVDARRSDRATHLRYRVMRVGRSPAPERG